jgi:accessory secretory protein Asp3
MAFWTNIYWDENTDILELQGASIVYADDTKDVTYTNLFFPSGFTLARWSSKVDYGQKFHFNALPTLIPGHVYRLTTSMTAHGLNPYMAITFYDAENEILWTTDRYETDRQFEVPATAERYIVEIVAFGEGSFTFHHFTLQEVIEGGNLVSNDWYQELPTGERLGVRGHKIGNPTRFVVSFSEPLSHMTPYLRRLDTENALQLSIADQRENAGGYRPAATDSQYERLLYEVVTQSAQSNGLTDIYVTGVGPVSRDAALYYSDRFGWHLLETSAPLVTPDGIGLLKRPDVNQGRWQLGGLA